MRPLIGVTCNYDFCDTVGVTTGMGAHGQDWNFVAGDYIYSLERAGAIPVMIPRYEDFNDVLPLLDRLDGVLLSGGVDLEPTLFGSFPKAYCGMVSPHRDALELAIVKHVVQEQKKAILGICRGVQVLNVACGGTVYQDLEKEGGFERHTRSNYPRNVAWHTVRLEADSLLSRIYDAREIAVNSYHHQAVKDVCPGGTIVAYSLDGVPEAIEIPNHPFAVGVQWHPEMLYDSDQQRKLFAAFVQAAAQSQ